MVPSVHANVAPVGEEVNVIAVVAPEQIVAVVGVVTVGFGLTVTVTADEVTTEQLVAELTSTVYEPAAEATNVEAFVPTTVPPCFQVYVKGPVPPLTFAVNVTDPP